MVFAFKSSKVTLPTTSPSKSRKLKDSKASPSKKRKVEEPSVAENVLGKSDSDADEDIDLDTKKGQRLRDFEGDVVGSVTFEDLNSKTIKLPFGEGTTVAALVARLKTAMNFVGVRI